MAYGDDQQDRAHLVRVRARVRARVRVRVRVKVRARVRVRVRVSLRSAGSRPPRAARSTP